MQIRVILPAVVFCAAFLASIPQPLAAQASGDFTFKRLTPPQGDEKRLNIQVEPRDEVRPVLSPRIDPDKDLELAPAAAVTELPWFWNRLSAGLNDGSPQRLELATGIIDDYPENRAQFGENPEQIAEIARRFGPDILRASIEAQVSPALLLAIIQVESGGFADKGSPTGPAGLMQLKPPVARQFGIEDVMNPVQNIAGGARYLEWLLDRFDGDALLALAAYHTSDTVVRGAKGIPNNPETRLYIPRVIAAWRIARTLCVTPPVKATDGCVFENLAASDR